jgi:two-component system, NarL family, sensor histidine kinase DegS
MAAISARHLFTSDRVRRATTAFIGRERELKSLGTAPPRAHAVDGRVADSPFVSLRYHVDTWATDLDELVVDVQRDLAEVNEHRARVMQSLRRNEEMRRHVLNALHRYSVHDVVRCFHDGLALTGELGRIEEQAAGLKRRLDAVTAEQSTFRAVADVLRQVAASGGIAINERGSRLSQASRRIFQIVDEEHEATARAILDGPMQSLSDAAFAAELATHTVDTDPAAAAEHASRCRAASVEAARELDALVKRLRPVDQQRSLTDSLRRMLRESSAGPAAHVRVIGQERRLPALVEVTVFRIVEEAVDNAVRHGHSERIDVLLSFNNDRVVVVVKDDGDGFDVVATEARLGRTRGLGLIEMHERAALTGSRLEVRSLIGAGTEVRMMLAQRAGARAG